MSTLSKTGHLLLCSIIAFAVLPLACFCISEQVYNELKDQYEKKIEQLEQLRSQALQELEAAKVAAEQKLAEVQADAAAKLREATEAGEKQLAEIKKALTLVTDQKKAVEAKNAALEGEVDDLMVKAKKAEQAVEEMRKNLDTAVLERDDLRAKMAEHQKALDIIFERGKSGKK
jgi:chromosome segregation ATPase